MCTLVPRVPNFRSFRSTISRFQDIAHFRILPLTPMLKVQSATFFFNFWQISKTFITLYSLMTALFIIKLGSDWYLFILLKLSQCKLIWEAQNLKSIFVSPYSRPYLATYLCSSHSIHIHVPNCTSRIVSNTCIRVTSILAVIAFTHGPVPNSRKVLSGERTKLVTKVFRVFKIKFEL